MSVWQVRTGFTTECWNLGVIVVGWDLDVPSAVDYGQVEELYRLKWPNSRKLRSSATQIWDFACEIKEGDYVVLPRDWENTFSIGQVSGPFQYRPDLKSGARMTRPVHWLAKAIPRSEFDSDIQATLHPGPSVLEIRRPRVDERISALMGSASSVRGETPSHRPPLVGSPPATVEADLRVVARKQVGNLLFGLFPGRSLAVILEAILSVQGYVIDLRLTDENRETLIVVRPDLEPQKLAVHVIEPSVRDAGRIACGTVRACYRAGNDLGVTRSMIVSISGFDESARGEAKRLRTVVLRDRDSILDAFLHHYDALPGTLREELRLERILVPARSTLEGPAQPITRLPAETSEPLEKRQSSRRAQQTARPTSGRATSVAGRSRPDDDSNDLFTTPPRRIKKQAAPESYLNPDVLDSDIVGIRIVDGVVTYIRKRDLGT